MKSYDYSFLGRNYKIGFFYDHYTFNGKRFSYDHLDALGYAAYSEDDEEGE